MPFKIKLKKSRQYNVVSKNLFIISVELLDNTVVECTLSSESTGHDCLSNVCQRLTLQQVEFFGLRFCSKRLKYQWVELDKPLKKQLDKNAQETYLYLGVMFYVADVHQLHDEMTRYQYFLQLKADVIDGRLPTKHEQAVELASFSLQAEFGDHDPERHTAEYLKGFHLLPKSTASNEVLLETLTEEIVHAHRTLLGVSPSAAEVYYIVKAQQLDGYGHEITPAKDESGNDVQLASSLNGIHIQLLNAHQYTLLSWNDVTNISFHKRNLNIECSNLGQTLQFQLEDSEIAKYLWKFYTQQHQFYCKGKSEFLSNSEISYDSEKYTVKSSNSENQKLLNQTESQQRLTESSNNLYQQDRHQSAEELRMNFSKSDTGLYDGYVTHNVYGTRVNEVLHADSIYSVNSLGHSTGGYNNQNLHSSSSLSITSAQSNNPQLRALLPSYRPAPDYETAVQHKYGSQSASLGSISGVHSYAQDINRSAFSQQDIIQQQLPAIKSYYHYKNFTNLANLDAITTYYVNAPLDQADIPTNGIVPHRVMDRIAPGSNLMLAPMHTYSTPELTSQGLCYPDETVDTMVLHHYKPPPPYPYNQRSSASTPDLASQTLVGNSYSNSSPHLVINKKMEAASKLELVNHVEHEDDQNGGLSSGSGRSCDGEIVMNFPGINNNRVEDLADANSSQMVNRQTGQRRAWGDMFVPSVNSCASMQYEDLSQGCRSRASSTQSAPEVIVSVAGNEPVNLQNLSNSSEQFQRHYLVEQSSNSNSNSSTTELFEKRQTCSGGDMKKEVSKEAQGYGPMMVAAMNGLTLSRPDLILKQADESRAPKDARRQVLESQLAEGLVFNEFEQIPKKRLNTEYTTATLVENAPRNRFKDVLPYEDNRVRLAPNKNNKTGYINASHISVTIGQHQRFYIAAQGPLSNTVAEFWQMMWEQHVQLIVMLTEVQEQGRNKCFPYWPQDTKKLEFGDYRIFRRFSTNSTSYITSNLVLDHLPSKQQRVIWHIQYTDWPDHGCPDDVHGFLNFMEEVHSVRRHATGEKNKGNNINNSPILVHCSAGVGRSGVTILIDIMLYCLDYNENIDLPKMLTSLRQQRMLIVQTVAQYKFVYTVLIQYLKNSRLI